MRRLRHLRPRALYMSRGAIPAARGRRLAVPVLRCLRTPDSIRTFSHADAPEPPEPRGVREWVSSNCPTAACNGHRSRTREASRLGPACGFACGASMSCRLLVYKSLTASLCRLAPSAGFATSARSLDVLARCALPVTSLADLIRQLSSGERGNAAHYSLGRGRGCSFSTQARTGLPAGSAPSSESGPRRNSIKRKQAPRRRPAQWGQLVAAVLADPWQHDDQFQLLNAKRKAASLMPGLYSLAAHGALQAVQSQLLDAERVLQLYEHVEVALWEHARGRLNRSKTKAWNAAGEEPQNIRHLQPRGGDPVWVGDWVVSSRWARRSEPTLSCSASSASDVLPKGSPSFLAAFALLNTPLATTRQLLGAWRSFSAMRTPRSPVRPPTRTRTCGGGACGPMCFRLRSLRWSCILSVAAQRAFATSLLELPLHGECQGGGPEPELHEVFADSRWTAAPATSRVAPRAA
ncbi:unnamed protein product [Symbiodinium natans]|uniref:Uncharacterized protein n=1 Tax=Symbiodinium natans TaxID=878477 RepID=A0A812MEY1_9DINO|nr:unnamed protein product [Symbiodinium natans]